MEYRVFYMLQDNHPDYYVAKLYRDVDQLSPEMLALEVGETLFNESGVHFERTLD